VRSNTSGTVGFRQVYEVHDVVLVVVVAVDKCERDAVCKNAARRQP